MDVPGDILRVRLRKKNLLKLKTGARIGKALALNAGMRDAEMKTLTWAQINFGKQYVTVGQSKTEAGEGRTIPLNSVLLNALSWYAEWYQLRFGELRADWYIFPFGKPRPYDPTRPVTTL